jgi:hypothetical protein
MICLLIVNAEIFYAILISHPCAVVRFLPMSPAG